LGAERRRKGKLENPRGVGEVEDGVLGLTA
jgi:hypothetical protein